MEKRISFVVRFTDGISKSHEDWQGLVEFVQTGEKRPFKGVRQFLEQIEKLSKNEEDVEETK